MQQRPGDGGEAFSHTLHLLALYQNGGSLEVSPGVSAGHCLNLTQRVPTCSGSCIPAQINAFTTALTKDKRESFHFG